MALLAAYRKNRAQGETLPQYLEQRVFAGAAGDCVEPNPADPRGLPAVHRPVSGRPGRGKGSRESAAINSISKTKSPSGLGRAFSHTAAGFFFLRPGLVLRYNGDYRVQSEGVPMNEKEVAEIRRRFKPEKSTVTHVRGCYVSAPGGGGLPL